MKDTARLNIYGLTAEQLTSPLGVGPRPRFSYKVDGGQPGECQKSVCIRVYSGAEAYEKGDADMWDCTLETQSSTLIEYDGAPLEPFCRYFWTAEVTSDMGRSSVSGPASFVTGDFLPWRAQFMGPEQFSYARNRALYCRADFTLEKEPECAYALVCGLGYHVFSINGIRQGDAVLEPGFTTFDKRVQYVMHDITPSLRMGENTLGIVLGEGWYNNRHEVFERFDFLKPLTWLGLPKLSYEIYIKYKDGSSELLLSGPDSGLTVGAGPITYNDLFNGEHYDARLERAWDVPGGTPLRSRAMIPVAAPCDTVEPELAQPIRVTRDMEPVSVSSPAPGIYVYDFGQNFAGWVKIETELPGGSAISLRFAEMLYEDGTVNQENLRWAKNHDVYICRGGKASWEPSFTYHGFRYVQLEGCTPQQIKLTGRQVRSDIKVSGSFSCSDELLNRIQQCVLWTEESNLHSVPTDCPQRDERQGWVNDCTVRIEEIIYNFSCGAFLRKWMKDLADTQEADGSIKDVAPRVFGADKADPLSSIFLFVPWYSYMFFGDAAMIGEYYEQLKAWEQYLVSRSRFGIMQYYNYGDWAGPVDGGVGGREANSALSAITPGEFVATVFFYENARLLARMARLLKKPAEAAEYTELADYIRSAINREYLNGKTGQYALGSQASNLLALHFDIVPASMRKKVLKNLVDDIKAHDYHLTTGNIATKYLFDVLSDEGLADVAYRIATKTDYPGWGYMLAMGATTIWERWELGTTSAMNSHNHPMYGTISTWFYKHLAGITPLAPAFEQIRIAPCLPEGLSSVCASMDTPRGTAASAWERTPQGVRMEVTLPFGTPGEIVLPEGFRLCPGSRYESAQEGRTLHLCSGTYVLELEKIQQ